MISKRVPCRLSLPLGDAANNTIGTQRYLLEDFNMMGNFFVKIIFKCSYSLGACNLAYLLGPWPQTLNGQILNRSRKEFAYANQNVQSLFY